MKIWEILKRENIGKKYRTKVHGIEEVLEVGYDIHSDMFLTLKRNEDTCGVEYPLDSIYLHCILQMDIEEVK